MKAIVTGGGGFLGRYIVEQLIARGDTVTVFARGHYPELEAQGVAVCRGDLNDLSTLDAACKGMEVVFHVAAKTGFWGAWDDFYQANVVGTRHVIAACRQQNVPKLVFTSSPSVVFSDQSHEGCDESVPYPTQYENFYSHTKAMAEQTVIQANGPDLLTVSLRPHLVWGPRDVHILPRLIARARADRLIQVGDGTNKVDLTYVEDAAQAHLLAADALSPSSPVTGSIYFISQDDPIILWSWVNDLLQALDIPPIKRKLPLPLTRFIGATLEGVYRHLPLQGEPLLTRFLANALALSHYYDISRAKEELGYAPKFRMDDALEKTILYLRAWHKKG